ncbi:hypothetical protein [Streptomyces sp. SudanB66_2053]|uniref:hypothetical protein n=1 Tax=Streptomyces TaxID=1883 RepID=UPI003F571492
MNTTSVPVTVFARTTSSPAHTCQVTVPIDLAQVFKPWGPFPGVAEVRDQTGPWNRPGTSRRTWFTDGSKADERLMWGANSLRTVRLPEFRRLESAVCRRR